MYLNFCLLYLLSVYSCVRLGDLYRFLHWTDRMELRLRTSTSLF